MRMPQEVAVRLRPVAAWARDGRLRVAPHAVLDDAEARRFDVLLDPDAPEPVQGPQAAERQRERERADRAQPERLHSQLVEAPGIEEPARPGGEIRCERGHSE